MKITIEADDLKLIEPNEQTATLAAESGGIQEVQYQKASATLPAEGNVSYSGKEDLPALKERVMCAIALNYLQTTPPKSSKERDEFKEYLREMKLILTNVAVFFQITITS